MKKIFILIGSLAVMAGSVVAQAKKPNIILILADDMGYGDLGCSGSKQIKTPNIDNLAKNGVFFERAYVSAAVCAPSRAGLLTGVNQATFGFASNIGDTNQPGYDIDSMGVSLSQKMLPQYLAQSGYITGIIGKWHLGYQDYFSPVARGFHEFWGYRGGGHDYFRAENGKKGYLAPIECNFKTPQPLTYITDDKGDECVAFIRRHVDKPFFLFASFNAPHAPLEALPTDLELYKNIADKGRRTYAAMVHRLDVNVGKIVAAVEKAGLMENTLFVFLSDNGGPVSINHSINAPYRGMKGTSLDGGIHVPLIVSWKGTLPKGMSYPNLVSSLDLTPTFVYLSGYRKADQHKFSGVNLFPYLTGKKGNPHDTLYIQTEVSTAIITNTLKLITFPDRYPELYNLASDKSELNNLEPTNRDKARALLKSIGEWNLKLPYPYFQVEPYWQTYNLKLYDKKYQLTQPE